MAAKKFKTILIERGKGTQKGITWLILNRPEKRNAMSPELHFEMSEALDILAEDPDTHVLVLTGAGKAFSAGQDLALYFRANEKDAINRVRTQKASHAWRWEKLVSFPKPTIAMVNGFCFGGAFTQLCACDFAISSHTATFGLSEVNWGIIPGGIVSWNVADVLSYRDALYYAVTGDPFDGKTAEKIRLVNYSVPAAKLKAETVKLAKKLMTKSPNAMRYTKEAIRAVRRMGVNEADDYLTVKNQACKMTDKISGRDEGMRQFLDEKSYRPGLGQLDLKKAARRKASSAATPTIRVRARKNKAKKKK
jgi:trans-feruloyl-CoA hydratase/vanillin synthase